MRQSIKRAYKARKRFQAPTPLPKYFKGACKAWQRVTASCSRAGPGPKTRFVRRVRFDARTFVGAADQSAGFARTDAKQFARLSEGQAFDANQGVELWEQRGVFVIDGRASCFHSDFLERSVAAKGLSPGLDSLCAHLFIEQSAPQTAGRCFTQPGQPGCVGLAVPIAHQLIHAPNSFGRKVVHHTHSCWTLGFDRDGCRFRNRVLKRRQIGGLAGQANTAHQVAQCPDIKKQTLLSVLQIVGEVRRCVRGQAHLVKVLCAYRSQLDQCAILVNPCGQGHRLITQSLVNRFFSHVNIVSGKNKS